MAKPPTWGEAPDAADSFRPLIAMTTITRPLPGGLADARGLPRGLAALLRRYLDVGPRGPQVADGAAGAGGPDAAPGLLQFLGLRHRTPENSASMVPTPYCVLGFRSCTGAGTAACSANRPAASAISSTESSGFSAAARRWSNISP